MDTNRRLDRPAAAALTRRFARAGYPTHEVVAKLVTEVAMGRAPLYAASGSVAPQDSEPVTRSVVLHCASPPILPDPSGSPFILVNGHIPEPGRTLIPAHHVGLGRNVVAVSDGRGQTRRLVTAAPAGRSLGRFSTSSI